MYSGSEVVKEPPHPSAVGVGRQTRGSGRRTVGIRRVSMVGGGLPVVDTDALVARRCVVMNFCGTFVDGGGALVSCGRPEVGRA